MRRVFQLKHAFMYSDSKIVVVYTKLKGYTDQSMDVYQFNEVVVSLFDEELNKHDVYKESFSLVTLDIANDTIKEFVIKLIDAELEKQTEKENQALKEQQEKRDKIKRLVDEFRL